MKILLITTVLLLSVSYLTAQEKKAVDTYKIAFFSKDASGVFKEMSGTVETSKPGVPTAFNLVQGTYSVEVTDEPGCKASASADLTRLWQWLVMAAV